MLYTRTCHAISAISGLLIEQFSSFRTPILILESDFNAYGVNAFFCIKASYGTIRGIKLNYPLELHFPDQSPINDERVNPVCLSKTRKHLPSEVFGFGLPRHIAWSNGTKLLPSWFWYKRRFNTIFPNGVWKLLSLLLLKWYFWPWCVTVFSRISFFSR
jgi:hypothetical protein